MSVEIREIRSRNRTVQSKVGRIRQDIGAKGRVFVYCCRPVINWWDGTSRPNFIFQGSTPRAARRLDTGRGDCTTHGGMRFRSGLLRLSSEDSVVPSASLKREPLFGSHGLLSRLLHSSLQYPFPHLPDPLVSFDSYASNPVMRLREGDLRTRT